MPYIRQFTDEQLRKFRSDMARNRKNNKGGRKPKPPEFHVPKISVQVREPDYNILNKAAFEWRMSKIDIIHLCAEAIKSGIVKKPEA